MNASTTVSPQPRPSAGAPVGAAIVESGPGRQAPAETVDDGPGPVLRSRRPTAARTHASRGLRAPTSALHGAHAGAMIVTVGGPRRGLPARSGASLRALRREAATTGRPQPGLEASGGYDRTRRG